MQLLHLLANHFETHAVLGQLFETSQMVMSSSENVQMVSAKYLVKELMDLDHILHTYKLSPETVDPRTE